jgi:hypothetical protein
MRRVPAPIAGLAGLLLACGLPRHAPPPARVSVEVLSGAPKTLPAAGPASLVVLVDQSESMRERLPGGASRAAAARAGATSLLRAAPPGSELSVRVLGGDGVCDSGTAIRSSDPEVLARVVSQLEPRGAGSLAAALEAVRAGLHDRERAARTRVVAFTDLEPRCGGDLCAAAAALVETGSSLDLVVLGGSSAPLCLAQVEAPAGPPSFLAHPSPPPAFRVEAEAEPEPHVLLEGTAGDPVAALPPGPARVLLQLDPPLVLGPFDFASGTLTRVRVVDLPRLGPEGRAWRVETLPAVEAAAP